MPGVHDCNSNIGAMLELVRVISHWAHGFKHAVIFLFNTGEEEGLIGAHGFITQVFMILFHSSCKHNLNVKRSYQPNALWPICVIFYVDFHVFVHL